MSKRKLLSGEKAVEDILKFVYDESGDEESDLEELFGDDSEVDMQIDNGSETHNSTDDEEILHEAVTRRTHRKKQLTYSRKVHSIDSALTETNYDIVELSETKCQITGKLPTDENKNKKRDIHFVNFPPKTTGRQNKQNVIKNKPGVHGNSKNIRTEREGFEFYITEAMVQDIVNYTNKRITNTLKLIPEHKNETGKYPYLKTVDSVDIYAVFGLMFFRGLYGLNNHDIRLPFSKKQGLPIFGATMSRLRFQFIISHISFDDIDTRNERWKQDRFAAIRDFFEQCNNNFAAALVPVDYITLDETLYPMRTQVNFKQYNPDKPAKYGMLFKSLNSGRYPYTYQSHVYCGKPEEQTGDFYVQGTINYIKYLVEKLSLHHSLHGRNITMDRLYTSFEIANWLYERKVTIIGTMQSNRVGIPPSLKETKGRENLSSEIYWEVDGITNISSYAVKSSKGMKNVLMLSTIEPILGTTIDDDKKKPALYKLYDFTKGGTDIVDQKIGSYSVKAKSRKWTMVAFSYLLDTVRINACTLFSLANNDDPTKKNAFDFGYALAKQLVMPHIQRRNRNGLTSDIILKIQLVTEEIVEVNEIQTPNERGRCKSCLSEIAGIDYKKKRQKVNRINTQCSKCKSICCKKHSVLICKTCL